MNDTTSSLYEHIKNRLPTGFGYGNDGQVIVDKVKSQAVWQQTLREDHPGDVGIFEIKTVEQKIAYGAIAYVSNIQFGVVCKSNDINNAINYLLKAYDNIKKDRKSSSITVDVAELINCMPIGKNSEGNQMVAMNLKVTYTKKSL